MPICPYCTQQITMLHSNLRRDLVWHDGRWVVDISYKEDITVCSSCYEELGPRDLEKLGVPNQLR